LVAELPARHQARKLSFVFLRGALAQISIALSLIDDELQS